MHLIKIKIPWEDATNPDSQKLTGRIIFLTLNIGKKIMTSVLVKYIYPCKRSTTVGNMYVLSIKLT